MRLRDLRFWMDLVAFIRGWPASAVPYAREPIRLDAALREIEAAKESRDTRRLRAAYERARLARIEALRREQGRA